MVSPTNMGTALLQWHPPANTHGTLLGYRLRFGRKDVEPLTVIEFPERESHYTTKEIHKGASYIFRLSARNKVGFGEETVKEITTAEDVPSGYPQAIAAEAATATTIRVSWRPVLLAERNGAIVRYALQYKDINSPQSPSELFIKAPESSVTLDGLRADTTYDIKMCAFTSKGPGPYSPSVQFRTQPVNQGRSLHVLALRPKSTTNTTTTSPVSHPQKQNKNNNNKMSSRKTSSSSLKEGPTLFSPLRLFLFLSTHQHDGMFFSNCL